MQGMIRFIPLCARAKPRWWVILVAALTVMTVLYVATIKSRPVDSGTESVDRIVVHKAKHEMVLLRAGKILRVYQVALGRGGLEAKQEAGDNKVPEGTYHIAGRNVASAYHRSLKIGYPTPRQLEDARARGIDPGGAIMIHGIRNGLGWIGPLHRQIDWTRGCVAVTNSEIEEIWQLVPNGTIIDIRA